MVELEADHEELLEVQNCPTFLLHGPAGARDRVLPLVVGPPLVRHKAPDPLL